MSKIRTEVGDMTQAQPRSVFGVSQPRINDLLRGKIEKFSLDALVNMLLDQIQCDAGDVLGLFAIESLARLNGRMRGWR